jgi:hypothetical protein
MATSLTLENDSSLAQGYLKVNGSTAATLTTSGITGNLTGNVTGNLTGNVTGNADTATNFSTTTGSAPAYACRAWVNFDGTRDTTGAVSTANTNRLIRASGNVASVLRNGLGDYTITFTTAMSDANYAVSGNCIQLINSGSTGCVSIKYATSLSSSSFTIVTKNDSGTSADAEITSIAIFR